MMFPEATEKLMNLGLNRLEAEIYIFLLQNGPATGYRIAKGLGRTNANTYKAVASLESRGAVQVNHDKNRLCRAVPPAEYLGNLENRFVSNKERARNLLENLHVPNSDHRIYTLTNLAQIKERARSILDRAKHIALLDIFPAMTDMVGSAMEAAAKRGVQVTAKIYEPWSVPGAYLILRRNGDQIYDFYPMDTLEIAVDGREFLNVYLDAQTGEPVQAVWSADPMLAYATLGSLGHHLILTELKAAVQDGANHSQMKTILDRHAPLAFISSRNQVYREHMTALGYPGFSSRKNFDKDQH